MFRYKLKDCTQKNWMRVYDVLLGPQMQNVHNWHVVKIYDDYIFVVDATVSPEMALVAALQQVHVSIRPDERGDAGTVVGSDPRSTQTKVNPWRAFLCRRITSPRGF